MDAIVINTLGLQINLKSLKLRLARMWQLKNFELIDLVHSYYIVRTKDQSVCDNILSPKMPPSFNPNLNILGKIALWVRLTIIPIQWYDKEILWRLGNCIGKTLKVDSNSLSESDTTDKNGKTERGKFVRISIEVDLQKKLGPRLLIKDELFNVEYESLNLICFRCGCYGHNKNSCNQNLKNKNPEKEKENDAIHAKNFTEQAPVPSKSNTKENEKGK
ncbi:uncharacterized protein LOC129305604 [Prosopis cineraria]|uniref:uncharacterized protein LOC129305604 n=1 Tax=Prosopis cineraria TaxID=364024 RepID=UPI002410A41F|nr:uncharacterized protein LOC129305604 [Prosopis cineraria]